MKPFDPNAETRKTRRNLPHWSQEGCLYFLTFRLADSLAKEQLQTWENERDLWLGFHPQPWDEPTWLDYDRRFARVIDAWLDAGSGACLLAEPHPRSLVVDALRHFDGTRYHLDAFVVMPNHVHVLCAPVEPWDTGRIRHTWKFFTAKGINRYQGTTGPVWRDEGFDHIVRSDEHRIHYRRYIRENPVKAHLSANSFTHWESPPSSTE